MIVRTWRGRASAANVPAYLHHFRHNVLPQLRKLEGFRGTSLLKEERPDGVELFVLTRWVSMNAVRAFAGDDAHKAVVEPEAVAVLIDFDQTVRHYEVVEETSNLG